MTASAAVRSTRHRFGPRVAGALGAVLAVLATGRAASGGPVPMYPETPAPPGGGRPGALWRAAAAGFDAASAEREVPLAPPVPVPVSWRPRRFASLDLGASLLALAAGDLDRDGRAELVALTERDVVVLRVEERGAVEMARAPLPSEPATVQSRDAVGTLVVTDSPGSTTEILASASTRGRGSVWRMERGQLREAANHDRSPMRIDGFPVCVGRVAALVPGRNYFAAVTPVSDDKVAGTAGFFTVRCRDRRVDERGRPLRARITVGMTGAATIEVETQCRLDAGACTPLRTARLERVGATVELEDVDRDGAIEVIVSGAGAPGDADAVAVWSFGADGIGRKPAFRRAFLGGVVGLAAGDVDGDGDRDVFAAVRLVGARKVDLWRLN